MSKVEDTSLPGQGQLRHRVIAVTGKGGTGKTMLATLIIKTLTEDGNLKILAIDADSAASLPYTLGMQVRKTVGKIRQEIIDVPDIKREMADVHIRTVMAGILEHGEGFDLLVMGRPEAPGCFCGINDLLRYGIETLSQDYDFTIIDGEAGPEQINRRVVQSIDTLLVVADTSARSLRTAVDIAEVARGYGNVRVEKTGLIVNRVTGASNPDIGISNDAGLDIVGSIPEDGNITFYDAAGKSLLELPENSPSLAAVRQILSGIA